MISAEELFILEKQCRFKNREIQELRAFLHPTISTCTPSLLIEGPPSSGKTFTLTAFVKLLKEKYFLNYVIIDCKRAFSAREVLRRILKSLIKEYDLISHFENNNNLPTCQGIESIPGCISCIMEMYVNVNGVEAPGVIVVLDGIDKLEEVIESGEIVKCLNELREFGEEYDKFTFIHMVTRGDLLDVTTLGIPTVRFSGYKVNEFTEILVEYWREFWDLEVGCKDESSDDSGDDDGDNDVKHAVNVDKITKRGEVSENEKRGFFKQFVELMLQTYSRDVGMSVDVVLPLLRKIWPLFVEPVLREGGIKRNKSDVLSTFMRNKKLLGEDVALVTTLENSNMNLLEWKRAQAKAEKKRMKTLSKIESEAADNKGNYDLSIKTKYLVIAAYLASYNEPKFDSVFFSKGGRYDSIISSPKKKRFKNSDGDAGRVRRNMAAAIPFKLERLLAILQAIWVESVGEEGEDDNGNNSVGELFDDVELMTEIATLSSLKTLVKMKSGDTIGGQTKWKCNVHWNVVKKFSDDVGFEIENHLQQ